MFRKRIVALLALTIPLLVAACHSKSTQPAPAPAEPSASAPAVETKKEPASVSDIQQKLAENGAKLRVDGQMGARTKAALRKFQKQNGLKVTGNPDSETLAKLGLE